MRTAGGVRTGGGEAPTPAESAHVSTDVLMNDVELWRMVAQAAPPLYFAAPDGSIIYANPAFTALCDADAPPTLPERARSAVGEVVISEVEVRCEIAIGRDADERIYATRHVPICRGGSVVAVTGLYEDITGERRAMARAADARNRFEDVIRSISDWVWEMDETLALTFVSERFSEALGLRPGQIQGRPITEIGRFPEPGPGTVAMTVEHYLEAHLPFRDRFFVVPTIRGAARLHRISGVPVFDEESGRFLGYRGTGVDVTAQHAAEQEARQSRRDLESTLEALVNKTVQLDVAISEAQTAAKAKNQFLMMMSHELRTPLNAIIGFAEVGALEKFGPLPAPYGEYMSEVLGAGRHLLRLIDDLLDLARIELSRIEVECRPIAIADVLREAMAMVHLRAREAHLQVHTSIADPDLMVMADPDRVRQVLVNLLSNAVKFTRRGGAFGVDIASVGDMVQIEVWDTGIGIPADKLDLVFEAFEQIHDGILKRSREGSGLGLTISRHLVELMDGEISVESAPGKGSRFILRLPAADDEPA